MTGEVHRARARSEGEEQGRWCEGGKRVRARVPRSRATRAESRGQRASGGLRGSRNAEHQFEAGKLSDTVPREMEDSRTWRRHAVTHTVTTSSTLPFESRMARPSGGPQATAECKMPWGCRRSSGRQSHLGSLQALRLAEFRRCGPWGRRRAWGRRQLEGGCKPSSMPRGRRSPWGRHSRPWSRW